MGKRGPQLALVGLARTNQSDVFGCLNNDIIHATIPRRFGNNPYSDPKKIMRVAQVRSYLRTIGW